jgi:hypothetical protein
MCRTEKLPLMNIPPMSRRHRDSIGTIFVTWCVPGSYLIIFRLNPTKKHYVSLEG